MSRLSWLKPNNKPRDNQTSTGGQIDAFQTPSTEPAQPILDYQPGAGEGNSKLKELIVPYSGVKMRERLEAITTIILGEVSNRIITAT